MLGEHALARHPWLERVLEFFREERSEDWIRAIARSGHGRGLAAAAFLKLRPAVDDIVQLLNDPEKTERRADAAWALGVIGDARATRALIDALSSGDDWLTGDAAEALGKIGNREALPMLRATLDRAGVYGQAEILRVLGKLGGPEDIPQVEHYATTDEFTGAIGRRRVAQGALKRLRP
jgi:HEAT repeat protein